MSKQYLLIGASAASIGALNGLRRLDPEATITIISAEKELPYNKCLLADYLAGAIENDRLQLCQAQAQNVNLVLGQKVLALDAAKQQVITDQGTIFNYDALFLGMGSSPWIPTLPGIEIQGIFTFHTHADSNAILSYLKEYNIKHAAIIGAGLSGLEAADALSKYGIQITIIEKNDRVLPAFLSPEGAQFLHQKIRATGAQLMLNQSVAGFESTNGHVKQISLASGQKISAQMVIVATGLRPNMQLCNNSGIAIGSHGIMVNEFMQTSSPNIYAGGDLIEVADQLTGKKMGSCLWPDAMQQGLYAAHAMAGKPKAYTGPMIITSSAFFGLKFATAGMIGLSNAGGSQQHQQEGPDFIHNFLLQDGRLKGFEVLGTRHNLGDLRRLLLTQAVVTPDQLC